MSDFEHAIQEAKKLAATAEGRQLAKLLQQLGGPDLQQAMDSAAAGDLTQAQKAIMALMKDPAARKLLQQLGGTHGK